MSNRKHSNLLGWHAKQHLTQAAKYLVLLAFTFVIVMPLLWMVLTSLKPEQDVQAWPPKWLPNPVTFTSYERAFDMLPIGRFFLNSIILAALVVTSNVIFCSLAAYSLSRKRFRGADIIFSLILMSMMIPVHVRIIPMYQMSLNMGLQDTYLGMALPIAVTGFGIFLMRQFFVTLPKEVEDAAAIDGCGDWGILFRIVIPMARPAIISLAIFAFVWSFEDFLWPMLITSSVEMRPIQVGITLFQGLVIYEWGPVMATTTLTVIPMLIFYICLQKYFVQGMTTGAVKG